MIRSITKRDKSKGLLRQRRGGLDFIELIVCLVIIAVSSVAVITSFYTAERELERQRWHSQAIQLLKGEAEYWKGRLHTGLPPGIGAVVHSPPFEYNQRVPNPDNLIVISARGAGKGDDILGELFLDRIQGIDISETPIVPDWYEIHVSCRYSDPILGARNPQQRDVILELVVPFIPAG